MKERIRIYTWFVEPLNDFTNRVIVDQILQDAEDSVVERIECEDGIHRNLYMVSYNIVKRIIASKISLSLKFDIFVREGKGKIRSADFILQNIRRKREKVFA